MAATVESATHIPPPSSKESGINTLGINTKEFTRLQEITKLVGSEAAAKEHRRNVESYAWEFGADMPVSRPYKYYNIDGTTYTFPLAHELFNIEAGINPQERNGIMLQGWRRFDALTKPSPDPYAPPRLANGVNIWYSPHGDSGLGFEFDSGRLYVSVNTEEGSKHINIKVAPSFDVNKLLDAYASQANVIRPSFLRPNSFEEDPQQIAMHYLANPFAMGININDFLKLNQSLIEQGYIDPNEVVYRSRRNDPNAQDHTFASIMEQFAEMLTYEQPVTARSGHINTPRSVRDLERGYIESILPYAYNGKIFLYGCSATTILESARIFNPYATEVRNEKQRKEYSLTCPLCGWTGRADPCELKTCPGCNATNEEILRALRKKEEDIINPAGIYDGQTHP